MTQVTISRQEQAELFVIEMDMVQQELEMTGDYEVFASCKKSLEMLKSEIATLGYEVQRVPTGWKLVEPVAQQEQEAEVAQVASTPRLQEDEMGLYAEVASSNGKGCYTVRVCAKWLYSISCDCQARGDCRHRVLVDRMFDEVRPTFSQQCAGVVTSGETINRLLYGDRYERPLKGSGVTGWKAAPISRKLAA